jgi:hypothetical protein
MSKQKYPLDWPIGYPRTQSPGRSSFKNPTLDKTIKNLVDEVSRLLYGRVYTRTDVQVVISSNIPLRNDGFPRADYMKSVIRDKGVAIYFKKGDADVVLCCDKWDTVESNLHSVYKTIEALRSVERWGVSDFIQRSFTGFKALPAPEISNQWWQVLGMISMPKAYYEAVYAYRDACKMHHPDVKGGSVEKFQQINNALGEAKKYFQV